MSTLWLVARQELTGDSQNPQEMGSTLSLPRGNRDGASVHTT